MSQKTRRQQLEEMLADDPRDPFLRYGLAMEHAGAGDDEAAAACFRELFAVAPDYVPAYLQAGQALARLGRSDEAAQVLRTGIEQAARQNDRHAADEMSALLASLTEPL
jgi:tetratricopeptide (TPR) repeat protein